MVFIIFALVTSTNVVFINKCMYISILYSAAFPSPAGVLLSALDHGGHNGIFPRSPPPCSVVNMAKPSFLPLFIFECIYKK